MSAAITFDLIAHLHRQAAFSLKTYGPGSRVQGVTDHIAKELKEVRDSGGDLKEWVDVIILGLDGAWRSGATPEQVVAAIEAKQTKNEGRTWPDWRTADPNKAIEHDRSGENPLPPSAPMQVSTTSVLVGQILVMAALLERALGVVKNVEAEGSDESEQLQQLIDQGEDAIATVLQQHAMPTTPISLSTNQEQSMSAVFTTTQPPALLTYWPQEGGIYIGIKATPDGKAFHVVAAIGDNELVDQEWGEYGKRIEGADSYHDGRANTEAMAAGGSELGKKVLALSIAGHTDWALPSQADGHLLAANAKHLMNQDDCYWLSTQYSANNAWYQDFHNGYQFTGSKDCEFRAVPVRCIQIV